MNKIKISVAQSMIIQRLQGGEELHHISGFNARCFFVKGNFKSINWNTISKLEEFGLVKRTDKFIELTEAGKSIKI